MEWEGKIKGPGKAFRNKREFLVSKMTYLKVEAVFLPRQGLQGHRKKETPSLSPTLGRRTDEMKPKRWEKPHTITMRLATIWLEACITTILLICKVGGGKMKFQDWWHWRTSENTATGNVNLLARVLAWLGAHAGGNAVAGTPAMPTNAAGEQFARRRKLATRQNSTST